MRPDIAPRVVPSLTISILPPVKSLFILLASSLVSQGAVVMTINYSAPLPTVVTATVTLDDSVLGTSFNFFEFESLPAYLIDFEVTVGGAPTGNGVYSVSNGDFFGMVFQTNGNLPTTPSSFTLANFSDINVFSDSAPGSLVPNGADIISLQVGGDGGPVAEGASLTAVPEPGSLLLLGLGGLALMRRRSR